MLSLALAKQNVLFLQKRWCGKVGGMFLKIKLDGGSIMAMMGSTSEKMYLYQVLGVVSPSESIKDHAYVGLMTEDPLTGHMPHHG
jgi:hypothetical protein